MPIIIQSQTPAPGATNHPAADFYEIVFASTLGIDPIWASAIIRVSGVDVFTWIAPSALTLAPGWDGEATLGPGNLTLRVRFRPTGGWTPGANYGAGGGPLVGQVERVRVFSEDTPFDEAPPDFDFATLSVADLINMPLVGGRHQFFAASCYVTGAGLAQRRDRVLTVQRTSPGVYAITLPPEFQRGLNEYTPNLRGIGNVPRVHSLEIVGGQIIARFFDPAGAPADCNFALSLRRI